MPTYALVIGGVVRNIVIAPASSVALGLLQGADAVDVTGLNVSPGYLYNGSTFSPGAPHVQNFLVEHLNDLFGVKVLPSELSAIGLAVQTDQQFKITWDLFTGQRLSTTAFLDALVSKGIITASRRDQFKV